MGKTNPQIIRPSPRRVLEIYAPLLAFWGFAMWFNPNAWFNLKGALFGGIFVGFLGIMMWTLPRKQALVLKDKSLCIQGAFARQEMAWEDIESVRLKPGLRFGGLQFGQQLEITFRHHGHLKTRTILDWFEVKGTGLVTCLQERLC